MPNMLNIAIDLQENSDYYRLYGKNIRVSYG